MAGDVQVKNTERGVSQMAMIGTKDKPTYYNIITEAGIIVDTAPASKVQKLCKELQKLYKCKLQIVLK